MRLALRHCLWLVVGGSLLTSTATHHRVHAQEPTATPAQSSPLEDTRARDTGRVVPTAEEVRFIALVNRERRERGLSTLSIDPLLIRIARKHSAEMRDKDYFSHTSPTRGLETPRDRYLYEVPQPPNDYACVGENLYFCTIVDVKRGHDAFMNSPTHRDNVLFARFERMGVGVVTDASGKFWVTQMFLTNTPPVTVAKNRRISRNK